MASRMEMSGQEGPNRSGTDESSATIRGHGAFAAVLSSFVLPSAAGLVFISRAGRSCPARSLQGAALPVAPTAVEAPGEPT